MLDVILKRIYKELPGTIALTIHDSIMTGILTNNVEAVRQIMTEELTFFVGLPPTIKREDNCKEKEENSKEKEEKGREIEENEGADIISNQYDATTLVNYN